MMAGNLVVQAAATDGFWEFSGVDVHLARGLVLAMIHRSSTVTNLILNEGINLPMLADRVVVFNSLTLDVLYAGIVNGKEIFEGVAPEFDI